MLLWLLSHWAEGHPCLTGSQGRTWWTHGVNLEYSFHEPWTPCTGFNFFFSFSILHKALSGRLRWGEVWHHESWLKKKKKNIKPEGLPRWPLGKPWTYLFPWTRVHSHAGTIPSAKNLQTRWAAASCGKLGKRHTDPVRRGWEAVSPKSPICTWQHASGKKTKPRLSPWGGRGLHPTTGAPTLETCTGERSSKNASLEKLQGSVPHERKAAVSQRPLLKGCIRMRTRTRRHLEGTRRKTFPLRFIGLSSSTGGVGRGGERVWWDPL